MGRARLAGPLLVRSMHAFAIWLVLGAGGLVIAAGSIEGYHRGSIGLGVALALSGPIVLVSRAVRARVVVLCLTVLGAVIAGWYVLTHNALPGTGTPAIPVTTAMLSSLALAVVAMAIAVAAGPRGRGFLRSGVGYGGLVLAVVVGGYATWRGSTNWAFFALGILAVDTVAWTAAGSGPRLATARGLRRASTTTAGIAAAIAVTVLVGTVLVPVQASAWARRAGSAGLAPTRPFPPRLTGHVAWQGHYVADSRAGAVVLFSGGDNDDGIGIVDPRTGRLRWRHMDADQDALYENVVVSPDGHWLAAKVDSKGVERIRFFDAATGWLLNERTDRCIDSSCDARDTLLAVGMDRSIVLSDYDGIASRPTRLVGEGQDGRRRWSRTLGTSCDATVVVDAVGTAVVHCGTTFLALDPRTGRERWSRRFEGSIDDVRRIGTGHLVVDSDVRRIHTLSVMSTSDGRVGWRRTGIPDCVVWGAGAAAVVVAQCLRHGGHDTGRIQVTGYRVASGRPLWRTAMAGKLFHYGDDVAVLPDGRTVILLWRPSGVPRYCGLVVLDPRGRHVGHFVPRAHGVAALDVCVLELRPTPGPLMAGRDGWRRYLALD